MFPNVKQVLDSIIEEFKNGTVAEKIAIIKNPVIVVPSNNWSLMNQLIMIVNHTADARGYKQWLEVKRHVKKGAKSFKILVPCFKKNEADEKELAFFTTGNVFRVEDTDGEQLDYEKLLPPDLPFIERATEWGIKVIAVSGDFHAYGYFKPQSKVIGMATQEEQVFLHELMHVSDEKCQGKLKNGQDPIQEIVAELGAHALSRMVGKTPTKMTGNTYCYIEGYAKELNLTVHSACLKVISRVEKALNLILKGGKNESITIVA